MSTRGSSQVSTKDMDDAVASTRAKLAIAIRYWEKLEYDRWFNSVCAFSAFVLVLLVALIGVSIFFYHFFRLPVSNLGQAEIAQAITRVVLFGTIIAFVALKAARWLSAEDMTIVITTLVRNPRSTSVTEAPSPTTPIDAFVQHVTKAAQEKAKGHPAT